MLVLVSTEVGWLVDGLIVCNGVVVSVVDCGAVFEVVGLLETSLADVCSVVGLAVVEEKDVTCTVVIGSVPSVV